MLVLYYAPLCLSIVVLLNLYYVTVLQSGTWFTKKNSEKQLKNDTIKAMLGLRWSNLVLKTHSEYKQNSGTER